MFQSYETVSDPSKGAARLEKLRKAMAGAGLQAFLVPRTDRYRGETVAPCDERLAWLTGFTGSAGLAVVATSNAAVFVDSRYKLQVSSQVNRVVFQPLHVPRDKVEDWLGDKLKSGDRVGFDPWLHSVDEVEKLAASLEARKLALAPVANLVDAVWADRPAPPAEPAVPHPETFSGEAHEDKLTRIGSAIAEAGAAAAVLTVPESVAWLLNIRGADIRNTPVVHASAIVGADGTARLFVDLRKVSPALMRHLGARVEVLEAGGFDAALGGLEGKVLLDKSTCPVAVRDALGAEPIWGRDPCVLPRACKNDVELGGARRAALRDGAAVIAFLAWLDRTAPTGGVTEISAAQKLESFRRAGNALRDISFDTISGAGPHGAIVHYRVTEATNAPLRKGQLYLVDSGGQYADGTTDITRTIAIGAPPPDAVRAFTLVLRGMIAISDLRWPEGLAGRDIDAVARLALWRAGLDYGHGTGHGIGSYLSVHEGPQGLSRRSTEPLVPRMILSNEPGYYREDAFGIRIENLLVVNPAVVPEGGETAMLSFETLTHVPIDRRLIDASLLSGQERSWLNAYHEKVFNLHEGAVSEMDRAWLAAATAPV